MQIKEIAGKLNISPRAIRFYEEKGLIHPAKSADNQYRSFTEKDVWKLQCIIALREVGMSIEDIRQALIQVDAGNRSELLFLLEFQRSVMFSQWLELKQIVETTDQMISMVKREKTLPLTDVYALAEGSKRLRELRKSWHDRWNFDRQAPLHDERVASGAAADYRNYDEALRLTVQWVAPVQGEFGLDIGTGTGNLAPYRHHVRRRGEAKRVRCGTFHGSTVLCRRFAVDRLVGGERLSRQIYHGRRVAVHCICRTDSALVSKNIA